MSEKSEARKLTEQEKILNEIANILVEGNQQYTAIGLEIGVLVDEKNAAYGDSFTKAAEFLKILYPDGIPVEAYTDALCIVRIFDKLMRLATSKDYNNERPYADIAGYAFLGLQKDRLRAEKKEAVKFSVDPNTAELIKSLQGIEEQEGMLPAERSEEEQLARPIIKKQTAYKRVNLDRLR